MKDCPCGSDFPYTDCCGPLIRGTGFADTAEDLMRSRYTAFAKQNWEYLVLTSHPEEKKEMASELIDILFTIICIANDENINLEKEWDNMVREKMEKRDVNRFERKEDNLSR